MTYLFELLNSWCERRMPWRQREAYVLGAKWAQLGECPDEPRPWWRD